MDAAAPSTPQATRRRVATPSSPAAAPLLRAFRSFCSLQIVILSRADGEGSLTHFQTHWNPKWPEMFRFAQHDSSGRSQFHVGRPRRVMLAGLFQHLIVGRRFVFVIVRFAIIFAHWIILEFIPHQNPPEIGMAVEANSIKIENFALLKFGAAPDGSERR